MSVVVTCDMCEAKILNAVGKFTERGKKLYTVQVTIEHLANSSEHVVKMDVTHHFCEKCLHAATNIAELAQGAT